MSKPAKKEENKTIRLLVDSLVCLFSVAFVIAVVIYRGAENIPAAYLINITLDIAAMVTGYVIYICCIIDVSRGGDGNLYYQYLLNAVFLGLFTDALAWLIDGIPLMRIANIVDNTAYYICLPVSCFFFWRYIVEFVHPEEKRRKLFDKIIRVGMILSLILCIVNVFARQYFTVDEQGVYSRSALYPMHQAYGFLILFFCLWMLISERRKLRRFHFFVMSLYILAPVVISVMTILVYGLSVAYPVMMVIMLLMYCVVNVSRGREQVEAARDLAMAAGIQKYVIPDTFPAFPDIKEFDLYASMKPAKEVGGDFYDFFMVDEDHLGVVMADVSGKGVTAALFMMISKSLIKLSMQAGESPSQALGRVNRQLMESGGIEMFVTVWAAVLDIKTGVGLAANAGHEDPILLHAGGKYEVVKYRHSLPVAVMEDLPFAEHEFKLEKGDKLFVYTDGVTEAMNIKSELFGEERLVGALNSDTVADPQNVLNNVNKAIAAFTNGADQSDDITMLCLEYRGAQALKQ